LGYLICPKYGMFILAFFNLTLVFFFQQEINGLLKLSKLSSYLGLGLFALLLALTYEGNTISEMSLLFISAALYFFIRALVSQKDIYYLFGNIVNGLSLGFALFSRFTDCLVNAGMFLFFIILMIKEKKGLQILYSLLSGIGSFVLISLIPVSIFLGLGAFKEMIQADIVENVLYVGNNMSPFRLPFMLVWTAVLIGFIFDFRWLRAKGEEKDLSWFLETAALFFSVCFIFLSNYPHYFIISYPVIGVIVSLNVKALEKRQAEAEKKPLGQTGGMKAFISVVTGIAVAAALLPLICFYTFPADNRSFSNYANYLKVKEALDQVPENSRSSTFVFDSDPSFYLIGDFSCSCKYLAFQSWQTNFNPEIDDAVENYVEAKDADYIIFDDYYSEKLNSKASAERQAVLDLIKKNYVFSYDNGFVSIYAKDASLKGKLGQ
jgi:hypothetical protein